MNKKKKLDKMKMPSSKAELDMSELEMPEMDEEESSELELEMEPMDMESEDSAASSMLADVSDDELLAELKKRGLSAELEMPSEEEDDSSIMA